MNKPDRRIERTRRLLQAALIDLMREKPYSDITIHDIADRADVARSTFYFHFGDKHDLLTTSIQEDIGEVITSLPPFLWEAIAHREASITLQQIKTAPRRIEGLRCVSGRGVDRASYGCTGGPFSVRMK